MICFDIFIFFPQRATSEGEWSVNVAEFVRHNDQSLVEAASKMLSMYQEELLPLASFAEFCDVVGKDLQNGGLFCMNFNPEHW